MATSSSIVFDVADSKAKIFEENKVVLLHCITNHGFGVPMTDCASMGLWVRICHISLPADPAIRRGVLMPDRADLKVQTFQTPKLLLVESSCIIRWKDVDGELVESGCIWKFSTISTLPMPVPATDQDAERVDELNFLLAHVPPTACQHCYPNAGQSAGASSADGEEDRTENANSRNNDDQDVFDSDASRDDDDEDESDEDDSDIISHPQVFNVMGSCVEKRYQDVLEKVQELMRDGETVAVRVEYEPQNPQDINAIKAEAYLDDQWRIFGTIQKRKIPKLTSAMRHGTITDCKLAARPLYRLNVLNSGRNGLTCQLVISNRYRWDRDDNNYSYNMDLSHL
ncbi:uncharacterized protein [Amphiura filiformis]|uniref:uncharacterized protein n=1 Tax=Amphiura filiformis TaxID=82378 RepID=UPI003B20BA13